MTKRLHIIGPGYLLSENPLTPVGGAAVVQGVFLEREDSSDPNSGAAGSEIVGLTQELSSSTLQVSVNDVVIDKNYIQYLRIQTFVSNIVIIRNYIVQEVRYGAGHDGISQFTFDNNIVLENFDLPSGSGGSLQHNLFLGDEFEVPDFNGPFRNNIATTISTDDFVYPESGGQATHNTAANGQFGSDNGNNSALPEDLFRGARGNSADGRYWLKPDATAALGTAHDGSDRGPFGGERPYVLSGVPNLPFIISLEVPPVSQPNTPFTVNVRAASGQ